MDKTDSVVKEGGTSYACKKSVEDEEAKILCSIYQEAFNVASLVTPCLQSYHPEEIMNVFRDEEIIKLISYLDGKPVGLVLITSNLSKVPWINEKFYAYNFAEHYQKRMVFYVKSILVSPKFQGTLYGQEGTRILTRLLKLIEAFLPEDSIFCYDSSLVLNGWFTEFLVKTNPSVHPLNTNWKEGMDHQMYFAFRKNYEEGYGKKLESGKE